MMTRFYFLAQSCFRKNIIIDPTSDEEAWQDGSLVVAFMPARKEITQLTLTGEWSDGRITNVWPAYCVRHDGIKALTNTNLLLPLSTGSRALYGCLHQAG
jgi:exosome complex RNA-binding protein Rrp42 (RNase PH superfamily)